MKKANNAPQKRAGRNSKGKIYIRKLIPHISSKLKYRVSFSNWWEYKKPVDLILMLEKSLSGWHGTNTKGSITLAPYLACWSFIKSQNNKTLVTSVQLLESTQKKSWKKWLWVKNRIKLSAILTIQDQSAAERKSFQKVGFESYRW